MTIRSGWIAGYDPGGNGAHGFAELTVVGERVAAVATRTLEAAEDVIALIEKLPEPAALGVDTLSCWSTAPGAWRPADLWLRRRYREVQASVMTPNGLAGSMGMNGMAVLIAARTRWPELVITETHPKVLYWHFARRKYDYAAASPQMNQTLSKLLGVSATPQNDHEWDAALSAFAAFEGVMGRWAYDLHCIDVGKHERLIMPCGKTHYFWPE